MGIPNKVVSGPQINTYNPYPLTQFFFGEENSEPANPKKPATRPPNAEAINGIMNPSISNSFPINSLIVPELLK